MRGVLFVKTVAVSHPNLHNILAAKFCGISQNTRVSMCGPCRLQSTSEVVNFLAAMIRHPTNRLGKELILSQSSRVQSIVVGSHDSGVGGS